MEAAYGTPQILRSTDRRRTGRRRNQQLQRKQNSEDDLGEFQSGVNIYQQNFDPTLELKVIEAITMRENALKVILHESQEILLDRPFSIGRVLQQVLFLREGALKCVEEVSNWREILTRPIEFEAAGQNYLLKMLQDSNEAIKMIPFGKLFRLELGGKNPFMMPYQTKRQTAEPYDATIEQKGPKVKEESGYPIDDLLQKLAKISDQEMRLISWGQQYLEEEERRYGDTNVFQSGWGYHRWAEAPWKFTPFQQKIRTSHVGKHDRFFRATENKPEKANFQKRTSQRQAPGRGLSSVLATPGLQRISSNQSTVRSKKKEALLENPDRYIERFGKEFAQKASSIPSTALLQKTMVNEAAASNTAKDHTFDNNSKEQNNNELIQRKTRKSGRVEPLPHKKKG